MAWISQVLGGLTHVQVSVRIGRTIVKDEFVAEFFASLR
jgi:hypothetical protein